MKKIIKKAQGGDTLSANKSKGARKTTSGMWVDENEFVPPFPVEYPNDKPKPTSKPKPNPNRKPKPKAKNGKAVKKKSFPDLNKDGKVTKADILKGRGVIAKKGDKVKKTMKSGGKLTKCKYGCK
jgi:hypothetical protein